MSCGQTCQDVGGKNESLQTTHRDILLYSNCEENNILIILTSSF